MPIDEWPEAINRSFHMNPNVYVYMQGPSEFGITGDASLKIGMSLRNLLTVQH
jgi:proline iminopeptidase